MGPFSSHMSAYGDGAGTGRRAVPPGALFRDSRTDVQSSYVLLIAPEGESYGGLRCSKRHNSPYELIRYVKPRLHEMRNLVPGWDGEHGKPSTTNAILSMFEILQKVSDRRTVFPYLSPDGEGGVLAEWHARKQKIEVEIDAEGSAFYYATDQEGRELLEGAVTPQTEHKLRRLLLDLSARVDQENPLWRELFAR